MILPHPRSCGDFCTRFRAFAAGFILGGAFMASPAVGLMLCLVFGAYIGLTLLSSKETP